MIMLARVEPVLVEEAMTEGKFNGPCAQSSGGAIRRRNSLAGRNMQDEGEIQGLGQCRRLNGIHYNFFFEPLCKRAGAGSERLCFRSEF